MRRYRSSKKKREPPPKSESSIMTWGNYVGPSTRIYNNQALAKAVANTAAAHEKVRATQAQLAEAAMKEQSIQRSPEFFARTIGKKNPVRLNFEKYKDLIPKSNNGEL